MYEAKKQANQRRKKRNQRMGVFSQRMGIIHTGKNRDCLK
jgi:hypothetical protein